MGPHMHSAGGQKALQCILQLSKCPPTDAHVRSAMETKMAAVFLLEFYSPLGVFWRIPVGGVPYVKYMECQQRQN
jgi:hypothetical protein